MKTPLPPRRIRRGSVRAAAAVFLLLCAGCTDRDGPPPLGDPGEKATELRRRYGQAEILTARIYLNFRPPGAKTLTFTINLWSPGDGRQRLSCKKYGVPFLEGIARPDGGFTAVLVRDGTVVTGELREIGEALAGEDSGGGAFFARLAEFAAELHRGPIPPAERYASDLRPEGEGHYLTCVREDGLRSVVELDRQAWRAETKTVYEDDELIYRLEYGDAVGNDREFDDGDLIRPYYVKLRVAGDDTLYRIKLKGLDSVPSIDPADLELEVPKNAPQITVREFAELLVEPRR